MISLVVLSYNSEGEIVDCLRSAKADGVDEIVVVDNASVDASVEVVSGLATTLIKNDRNLGFAAAANQGVRATKGDCVVLLNPDATVVSGALDALKRTFDSHPLAGAVGALVRNVDGSVQPTKRAFPTLWQSFLHSTVGIVWPNNPGTRAYVLADASFEESRQVDWVAMTAVMLRREAFDSIGGFDESFFFFVEDVDLCKRLRDAGWEIWFEPRAEVVHVWGASWTSRPLRFMWMHHRNILRFVRKHRRGAWVVAYPFVAAGLLVRFVLLALRYVITRRSVPAHREIHSVDRGARRAERGSPPIGKGQR